MNLPIDTDGKIPPRFRWRQVVETPTGPRVVEHEGMLPPSVEMAVAALVGIAKQLHAENEDMRAKLAAGQPAQPKKGRA